MKPRAPQPPVVQLVKLARRLGKIRSAKGKRPERPSEWSSLDAERDALATALKVDLVELARKADEEARARLADLQARLDALAAERSNPEARRRELAEAVAGSDWAIVHRDKADFLGPFTIEHQAARTRVSLGALSLLQLSHPTGHEVLAAVRAQHQQLQARAATLWPKAEAALRTLEAPLTWTRLIDALGIERAHAAELLFALSMAREGQLGHGTLFTRPPSLAQQQEAINLPRPSRPGTPDRVFAFEWVTAKPEPLAAEV